MRATACLVGPEGPGRPCVLAGRARSHMRRRAARQARRPGSQDREARQSRQSGQRGQAVQSERPGSPGRQTRQGWSVVGRCVGVVVVGVLVCWWSVGGGTFEGVDLLSKHSLVNTLGTPGRVRGGAMWYQVVVVGGYLGRVGGAGYWVLGMGYRAWVHGIQWKNSGKYSGNEAIQASQTARPASHAWPGCLSACLAVFKGLV